MKGRKTHEKSEPEEKVLALNVRGGKWNNKNGKFFKCECNKCGKYGHRASGFCGNNNKNYSPDSTGNIKNVEK